MGSHPTQTWVLSLSNWLFDSMVGRGFFFGPIRGNLWLIYIVFLECVESKNDFLNFPSFEGRVNGKWPARFTCYIIAICFFYYQEGWKHTLRIGQFITKNCYVNSQGILTVSPKQSLKNLWHFWHFLLYFKECRYCTLLLWRRHLKLWISHKMLYSIIHTVCCY